MTKSYISVFSGAGGLDLGLTRAGFAPALVTDESRSACATLRAAMPDAAVMPADIHDLLNTGTVATLTTVAPAVLVAGQPPLLGRTDNLGDVDPDDDAPQMMYRFLDIVAQGHPDAFIMATMPFLTSRRWGAVLTRLRRTARDLGYDTFSPVIDAAEYGTAQHRDRLFFIGMPRGAKPDVTAAFRIGGKVSAGTALRALRREAVRDTPCTAGVRLAARPVVRNSPYSGALLAGQGRMLDLRRVAPVLPAALGGNKTPVLDTGQLERDEIPWIEGYHDYLWRLNGTPEYYGKADQLPSTMRRLSLRECAALQGFPPDYPLRGAPLAQFKLVGSAVPPPLAEAVGRSVMAGLS